MNAELNTLRESMVEVYISETIVEHLEALADLRERIVIKKNQSAQLRKVIKFESFNYEDIFSAEIFYVEHSIDELPEVLYSIISLDDYERISKAINEKEATDIESLPAGGQSYKKWVFTV